MTEHLFQLSTHSDDLCGESAPRFRVSAACISWRMEMMTFDKSELHRVFTLKIPQQTFCNYFPIKTDLQEHDNRVLQDDFEV